MYCRTIVVAKILRIKNDFKYLNNYLIKFFISMSYINNKYIRQCFPSIYFYINFYKISNRCESIYFLFLMIDIDRKYKNTKTYF